MKSTFKLLFTTVTVAAAFSSCGGGSSNNSNPGVGQYGYQQGYQPGMPGYYPGIPGQQPGQYGQSLMKNFTCQLEARRGASTTTTFEQQITLPRNGGKASLFANAMASGKLWNIFNYSRMVTLAKINLEYLPAMSLNQNGIDLIKLSTSGVDGDISVSTTGFAGAENRIEIIPNDSDSEATELYVSCISRDASVAPVAAVALSGQFKCEGQERINGRTQNINYVNQLSDVISTGISITPSVFVQATGDVTTAQQGAVTYSQTNNRRDDSTVNARLSLKNTTAVSIEKAGYSLKVKCTPR